MSYACIDWKNPALWWSTAKPATYFIVSKFLLETTAMVLFHIKKYKYMHDDAKCRDSSRVWWAHSAPMEDNCSYIQYLFGPGQSNSGLLSSRGLLQFCHPQGGHKFVSLSFPRTSCQLNASVPLHPAEILFPRWEEGQFSFLRLPPFWQHCRSLQEGLREGGGGCGWRGAAPRPCCPPGPLPAQAPSPRGPVLAPLRGTALGFWPHCCGEQDIRLA